MESKYVKYIDVGDALIHPDIFEIYNAKDYPLNLERIVKAIDKGGWQTVDISGVLEALNETGYIIKLK